MTRAGGLPALSGKCFEPRRSGAKGDWGVKTDEMPFPPPVLLKGSAFRGGPLCRAGRLRHRFSGPGRNSAGKARRPPGSGGRPGRNLTRGAFRYRVIIQQRFQGTGRRSRRQPRQVRKEATVTVVAGCPVPKRAQSFLRPFVLSGCRAGAPARQKARAPSADVAGRRSAREFGPGTTCRGAFHAAFSGGRKRLRQKNEKSGGKRLAKARRFL